MALRPTIDMVMMNTALLWKDRSTCARRSVACVLADKEGRVLSIGYNGVAKGLPHCNEGNECEGAKLAVGADKCEGIHAEQNAILQCNDIDRLYTAYVTLSPCRSCIKLLLNTPCQRIVFMKEWDDTFSRSLWLATGREWIRY